MHIQFTIKQNDYIALFSEMSCSIFCQVVVIRAVENFLSDLDLVLKPICKSGHHDTANIYWIEQTIYLSCSIDSPPNFQTTDDINKFLTPITTPRHCNIHWVTDVTE